MNTEVQHVFACARSIGIELDKKSYKRLCNDPTDSIRQRIELQFGRVFSHIPQVAKQWRGVQQPCIDHMVAVTSLPPVLNDRTHRAIASWKKAGLFTISVNSSSEAERLEPGLVDEVVICDDIPQFFKKRTQYIHKLFWLGAEFGKSVLLINSDIEVLGDQAVFRDLDPNEAMIGIRTNYTDEYRNLSREPWGLDMFHLPLEAARLVPETVFSIGVPFWDYWLPWWMQQRKMKLRWEADPVFYHERHPLAWSDSDWLKASGWFEETYDISINWVVWRRRQPFPPTDVIPGGW